MFAYVFTISIIIYLLPNAEVPGFSPSYSHERFSCTPLSSFINNEICFWKRYEQHFPKYSGSDYSTDFLEGITLFPYVPSLFLMNHQDLKYF